MLRTRNDQPTLWESAAAKLLRVGKVRADTTVVAANVQRRTNSVCWPKRSPR
jgi:hypothetical protein